MMLKYEGQSENKFAWLLISLTKNFHTSLCLKFSIPKCYHIQLKYYTTVI